MSSASGWRTSYGRARSGRVRSGSETNADASPATCDNDDNTGDVTGTTDDTSAALAKPAQGDCVIDNTDAGQGVKDSRSANGNGSGNNNNN